MLYLDEGDAVGRHGDVVAELVEELRRNPQGGAAELKLIRPETETHVCVCVSDVQVLSIFQ